MFLNVLPCRQPAWWRRSFAGGQDGLHRRQARDFGMKAWDMPEAEDTVEYARQLILVPILHSPADMGTMAADLEAAYVERLGRRHWDEYLALLENFWQEVRAEIERLSLDYRRVDLYQDGLPVCGMELEIVEKAAAAGSENHQLLMDLVARGATLMGTEDPKLLLDEYHNVKAALARGAGKAGPVQPISPPPQGQAMAGRDAYIGRRIGQSLRPGRMGVLFLGMMHNVESFLPADMVVRRLVPPVLGAKDKAR